MTAKGYLEEYRRAQRKADALRAKYEELTAAYGDVHGRAYTGTRRAGTNRTSDTERKVERAADMLEKWRRAQLRALKIRQNIYALLEALPCTEADIMVRRYVWLELWEQIEQETGYTHAAVFRIHRQALLLVQDLIDAGAIEEIEADYNAFVDKYVSIYGEERSEDS